MADVVINIPVKSVFRAFTYRVPEKFSYIGVGWRVLVPFGGRQVEGFVLSLSEETALKAEKIKDIDAPVDDEAWFTPEMTAVAHWLAEFYLCSLAEIMRLFMPGKSGVRIAPVYRAAASADEKAIAKMERYQAVYRYLAASQTATLSELRRALPEITELSDTLAQMLRRRFVAKEYLAQSRSFAVYEDILCLCGDEKEIDPAQFQRRPAQRRLLETLKEATEISFSELKQRGFSRVVIQGLIASGAAEKKRVRRLRDSYRLAGKTTDDRPALTAAQAAALEKMRPALMAGQAREFLLHGVTGSGKTRVYMEAAAIVRRQERQVIVLVPEIALTGQLVTAFQAVFADDIIVIHSRLSVAERNDAFLRIRRREAGVIIGARSALFTPAADIGLIIMDEEQDASYKQDEAPRYHARVVASAMARIHGAALLLGSATPSLESFYFAQQGKLTLLSLPKRVGGRPLPKVECVDMRRELKQGNRRVISRALEQCIRDTISRGQQMILMLNRRGYSTFIMCRACGHVMVCRFCGLPLVYHRDGRLACHHCDTQEAVPSVCPSCDSTYIKFFGSGTEKLEQELRELVPMARVARFDRDTTRKKFAHAEILQAFRQGKYDILLGTQMVAKGHDIPNVTAVGILSADAVLNMPDFRAAERCFMLITQTAGRAGRGDVPGRVVVQCYNPGHYAVECALRQDYAGFYEREIRARRELFFPPFCRLIKLTFRHEREARAREGAERVKEKFIAAFGGQENQQLLGPAPDVVAKFKGSYRFCLLIKTGDLRAVQDFLRREGVARRADVMIDIDPLAM